MIYSLIIIARGDRQPNSGTLYPPLVHAELVRAVTHLSKTPLGLFANYGADFRDPKDLRDRGEKLGL